MLLCRPAGRALSLAELIGKARGPTQGQIADVLQAASARIAPKISEAFYAALEALRGMVSLKEMVELLEAGRINEVILGMDAALRSPEAWDPLKVRLVQAVQEAADAVSRTAPPVPYGPHGTGSLEVRFNQLNPRTAEYLRRYVTDTATELSDGARRAVGEAARVALRQGVTAGQGARDTARAIRTAIGLTAQQERAAANYEAALREGRMGAAAGYANRDRRFSHARQPDSDTIERMTARYRERALASRALTISRTEAIRALHIGQHELWAQQIREGRIKPEDLHRKWIYNADSKVRHAHRTIPKLNPDGVGFLEPFKTELGPLMFPGDPQAVPGNTINCRCTVITRLLPHAFAEPAKPEPPVKPVPVPRAKPVPKPKPLPDPLNLKAKAPVEIPWHDKSWGQATKLVQQAISRGDQVQVYHSAEHPWQSRHAPHALPEQQALGKAWINMGPPETYGVLSEKGQGTFRHEYGHHLDTSGGSGPAYSFKAAPEVKADAKSILKQLGQETSGRPAATAARFIKPAERIGQQVFLEHGADAADRAESEALVVEAAKALKEAKIDLPVEHFQQRPPEDETPMEAVFRVRGGAQQAIRVASAIISKSPRAMVRAAGADLYLMDFLGAITREDNSQGTFGYGHGKDYYAKFDRVSRDGVNQGQTLEAFANYVEAHGANAQVKLSVMRALAPKTTKVFESILKALAKGTSPWA